MSIVADILSSGGLGTAIGSVFGIGQKLAATWMENKHQEKEWAHELELHELQFQQDLSMAKQDLLQAEVTASAATMKASFEHDASFKPAQWVDNIRALVRPTATVLLIILSFFEPETYLALAGLALGWYFSSRVRVDKFL